MLTLSSLDRIERRRMEDRGVRLPVETAWNASAHGESWMRRVLGRRRRVVLVTIGVLLALDVGRSLWARVGYARPVEPWQPETRVYADLAWPPGVDLPAGAPVGRRLYAQRCAVCHGPDGRGNGPAAPSLVPRPVDFVRGQFKYKSTPGDQPPTDDDLVRVVSGGLQASAMPYFRDLLTPVEIRTVVAYLKGLSPAFAGAALSAVPVPPRVPPDATSIARGRDLYAAAGCASCHGPDGRRREWQTDARGYPVITRDLTAPWTFAGGSDPVDVWRRLTTLSALSPMPSFADATTPAGRWDLVNYVLSLARRPPWEPGGRLEGPGQHADLRTRGEYLVHAEMCGLCHTMINRTGIYRGDDAYLAGGMRVGAYPHGVFVARNLTSDPETGLGRWSEAGIATALRTGRAPDRVLNLWGMPWMYLHQLTDGDARAVARYLKTLPPVRNEIPPALRFGVVETIAAKLTRPLPAANPTVLTYADGNFGSTVGPVWRHRPQQALIIAQWMVGAAGLVAFVLVAPAGRRWPRTWGGWLAAALTGAALMVVAVVGWVLYGLPALRVIPPDEIARTVTASIPRPGPPGTASPEQTALAARGRYLYTVASCALCHGNDGAGGAKISWTAFGTLWARNITPDRDTGIGAWSDREIARAVRSGVTPDGRVLHWQGMIWDHASNWDEEDVRALIAYLRAMPPVRRAISPARPPAPDDCPTYTFWVARTTLAGCR
jgi:mono/diheme cytochrome c family protein